MKPLKIKVVGRAGSEVDACMTLMTFEVLMKRRFTVGS